MLRGRRTFILVCAGLILVYLGLSRKMQYETRRRRAELFMLRVLTAGLDNHLDQGGQLPSSWPSLSKVVDWERLVGICDHNGLTPLTNGYTILAQPVPYRDGAGTGAVFLVRSEVYQAWGNESGRWAISGHSNRTVRLWFKGNSLPDGIRSHLSGKK